MAVSYTIKDRVLRLNLEGTYTPGDVMSQFVAAINDPVCPNPVSLLLDVRRSETLASRPAEDIRRVAEFVGPYKERVGGRCAVIAESDVHFGLSRLGAVYGEGVGVQAEIFRTEEDAMAWLKAGGTPPA